MKKSVIFNDNFNRINKLAFPILISYMSGYLFTLADQMIIGRTSLEAYTAVSVVSNLLYALTGTLGIISLSLNIIGSKILGENNRSDYAKLFNTTMAVFIAIGIICEVVYLFLGKFILQFGFNMSGDILRYGYYYLIIAGLGTGLNIVLFIFSAFFKSIEKTKIILKGSIISNALNILIDYVLVFGKFGLPKLGVIGAAIGTITGLALNIFIYYLSFKKWSWFKLHTMINKKLFKTIRSSYIPLLGQDLIESSAFTTILLMIVTKLGPESTSAYNVIFVVLGAINLPIYAY